MSQSTITSASYENANLFTNHYLQHHVQQLDGWQIDEEARETFNRLQKLYADEGDAVDAYSEDSLRQNWIDEVLDILGFDTLGETPLTEGNGNVDRVLFDSANERREAARRKRAGDIVGAYNLSLAALEAKQWDADLEAEYPDERNYRNAAHQIIHYLENTPDSVQWGILTNGRKWRLYSLTERDTKTHYQIDLPELLVDDNLEEFMYFYSFFRADAFREVGERSYLETVRNESDIKSREIGEELQDNVFTALRILGEGFVATNDLDIEPGDEAALRELKQQSLVFLYRLMFLLYAEGHGLISPDSPRARREYEENFSIDQMRRGTVEDVGREVIDVAEDNRFDDEYSTYASPLHSRLNDLFDLVDTGNEELGIPPYNGGLFDSNSHEFLAEHEVADRYLAEVIYRLSTAKTNGEIVLVDYSDLDTRHLGSVYEGLLEHQFKIADIDLAAVNTRDGQVWKPRAEVAVEEVVETVDEGDLYVTSDSGERKATGSYYTPSHIVEYMVEETVDPLLADIREDVAAEAASGTAEYAESFAEEVLDLRIVDPAMGSGHFLIEAMEHLADEVQSVFRDAEEIEYDDDDVDQFKRKVAKECIYGVDRNEMAVELAKVSLWLETLASDQPLAFLDHHLKQGDSLVGADIEKVDALETGGGGEAGDDEQTSMWEFSETQQTVIQRLMNVYDEFLSIDNEDLEDVKKMERLYQQIKQDELRQRLVAVANVYTADHLGVDIQRGEYQNLSEAIDEDSNRDWGAIAASDWFRASQEVCEEYHAFHWRLEFPEVFYTEEGHLRPSSGFDAVVSNPPYIKAQNLQRTLPRVAEYLRSEPQYTTTEGRFDIYEPFLEQGANLASDSRVCYILPNKFFERDNGEPLRRYLTDKQILSEIVDFGQYQVFEGVTTYTCILSLRADSPTFDYVQASGGVGSADEIRRLKRVVMEADEFGSDPWVLTGPEERHVLDKMERNGATIGDISDHIAEGITSGDNDVLFVEILEEDGGTTTIRSPADDGRYDVDSALVEPLIDGDNIERYQPPSTDFGVIYPYEAVGDEVQLIPEKRLESKFAETYDYLNQFRDRLADRGTENTNDEYKTWYALYRRREKRVFESEKLLTPDVCGRSEFTMDDPGGLYFRNSVFGFVPAKNTRPVREFLLTVLNSSVTWFYIYQTSTVLENDYRRFTKSYLSPLPIPETEPHSDPREHEEEFEEVVERYTRTGVEPDVDEPSTLLAYLGRQLTNLHGRRSSLNLSIQDYLGSYAEGPALADLNEYQPASGVHESILAETQDTREGLRVGELDTVQGGETLVLRSTARYKPEDESEFDTDRYGFASTDPIPVIEFPGIEDKQADLVEEFIYLVNSQDDGFAGFYEQARSNISLIDRIEAITLPKIDDVEDGLDRYISKKQQASELDQQIGRLENLVDQLVYNLYGFDEEEIETIETKVGGRQA